MLCVSVLFPFLMALAMQTVDASHGGVVLGILPIATALVAVVITHERPKPLFWIASIIGAALVIAFAMRQGGGALSAGDLLLFAAVATSAVGYAFSGRITAQMPGWEVISWQLVLALPVTAAKLQSAIIQLERYVSLGAPGEVVSGALAGSDASADAATEDSESMARPAIEEEAAIAQKKKDCR